jgi:hypothetical protein
MFVNKDAIWHSEITGTGEKLFLRFIERSRKHFIELNLLLQKPAETQRMNISSKPSREQIWKIVISIILLSFALAGFVWLPLYSAILWLIFLVVAYPVALAYTTAKQSMDNRTLTKIYKAGLTQVPIIGKLFGRKP